MSVVCPNCQASVPWADTEVDPRRFGRDLVGTWGVCRSCHAFSRPNEFWGWVCPDCGTSAKPNVDTFGRPLKKQQTPESCACGWVRPTFLKRLLGLHPPPSRKALCLVAKRRDIRQGQPADQKRRKAAIDTLSKLEPDGATADVLIGIACGDWGEYEAAKTAAYGALVRLGGPLVAERLVVRLTKGTFKSESSDGHAPFRALLDIGGEDVKGALERALSDISLSASKGDASAISAEKGKAWDDLSRALTSVKKGSMQV